MKQPAQVLQGQITAVWRNRQHISKVDNAFTVALLYRNTAHTLPTSTTRPLITNIRNSNPFSLDAVVKKQKK